jgi:hypothetical protein
MGKKAAVGRETLPIPDRPQVGLVTYDAKDPRFANAYILRIPGAGNPFPLAEDEWQAVADRLPKARRKRSQPPKRRRG